MEQPIVSLSGHDFFPPAFSYFSFHFFTFPFYKRKFLMFFFGDSFYFCRKNEIKKGIDNFLYVIKKKEKENTCIVAIRTKNQKADYFLSVIFFYSAGS
jgi:hypothetical protein